MPFTPRAPIPRGFTTRFAPAPTGHLHLGHVASAVWVWGIARAHGGRVLLRIEDHDRGRSRPEYERSILEDLDWLGFAPSDTRRQSDSRARHEAVLASLERDGLAYPCSCSRSDIARLAPPEAGQEARYPGTCRPRAIAGRSGGGAGDRDSDPASRATLARRLVVEPDSPERFLDLRLGDQTQDPDRQCGDFLLRDRDGNLTYQFACVVDDLDTGVDLVIRGEDILPSTGRQIRLARMLGRDTPPRFLHHPLVLNADGRKLSKSAGDTGIRELRAAGRSRGAVLGEAARLAGVHPSGTPLAPDAIAALFV